MPLNLTPIPASAGKARIPQDEIDPDVALAVEEAYKYCAGNGNERLEVTLKDKDAGDAFLKQARSYAYYRDPRVVVIGNSFKTGARFRVEDYVARETADEDASGEA
jgi:hypothetical protein